MSPQKVSIALGSECVNLSSKEILMMIVLYFAPKIQMTSFLQVRDEKSLDF